MKKLLIEYLYFAKEVRKFDNSEPLGLFMMMHFLGVAVIAMVLFMLWLFAIGVYFTKGWLLLILIPIAFPFIIIFNSDKLLNWINKDKNKEEESKNKNE